MSPTAGLAISGDPDRPALARSLFDIYRGYAVLDEVRLFFRKDPAAAFNAAARDMRTDLLVGVGGDVYVGEAELTRLIGHPGTIVCASAPLTPRRRDIVPYPDPWTEDGGPFISGLFKAPRHLVLDIPFPEEPPFCEDWLFERLIRERGFRPVSVNVPCVHIDVHAILRTRTLSYLTLPGRTLRGFLKTLEWEWVDIWNAVRRTPNHEIREDAYVRVDARKTFDASFRTVSDWQ